MKPVFMFGNKRNKHLPNVSCLLEEGYDMMGLGSVWIGLMAPKGTSRSIIDKLALGFKKITEDKRAIAALDTVKDEFDYLGPDEYEKAWRKEFLAYKDFLSKGSLTIKGDQKK